MVAALHSIGEIYCAFYLSEHTRIPVLEFFLDLVNFLSLHYPHVALAVRNSCNPSITRPHEEGATGREARGRKAESARATISRDDCVLEGTEGNKNTL